MSKDNVVPLCPPGTEPPAKVQQAAPCPEGPWPATEYMDAKGYPKGPQAPPPPPKPWASPPEPPAMPPPLPTADDEPLSAALIAALTAHCGIPAEEACYLVKRKFETGRWHATDPDGQVIPADKWRYTAITSDGRASGWSGINVDWFRVIRRPAAVRQAPEPPPPAVLVPEFAVHRHGDNNSLIQHAFLPKKTTS